MISSPRDLGLVGVTAAVLTVPLALAAQEGQQEAPPMQDTTELVFEREVFNYPTYQRRNPFEALTGDEGGPRFEDLNLIGIIHSPDPDLSVALLAEGAGYDEEGVLQFQEGRGGVQVGPREGVAQDTAAAQEQEAGQQEPPEIETVGYQTYRVRQGDQLGNMRILEIQRMRVIVEVEEFGITERREFVLRTPANRGGQP